MFGKAVNKSTKKVPNTSQGAGECMVRDSSTPQLKDSSTLQVTDSTTPHVRDPSTPQVTDSTTVQEQLAKLHNLAQKLHYLTKCPVCFGSLGSSFRQCKNGHAVCVPCKNKLFGCPRCQEVFLPNKPTLLNQVLELLPKPCRFNDKGCIEVVFCEEHETFCKFRRTGCKMRHCNWKGSVVGLFDHVKTKHNPFCEPTTDNNEMSRMFPLMNQTHWNDYSYYPVIFNNNFFWRYFKRNAISNCITSKLYHLPITKPTHHYYLTTSFKSEQIELESSFKAIIIDLNNDKAFDDEGGNDDQSGLRISDSDLKYFLDNDQSDSDADLEYFLGNRNDQSSSLKFSTKIKEKLI